MKRNKREHECLEILHEVIEHTQSFRVCRFGHINERTDFRSLQQRRECQLARRPWQNMGQKSIPRKKCVHFLSGSPTLAVHPCSSGAISNRPPCFLNQRVHLSSPSKGSLLDNFAFFDDTLNLLDHQRTHAHCNIPQYDILSLVSYQDPCATHSLCG